jgi:glycosyltransferase involved in cell wall biosynthesis
MDRTRFRPVLASIEFARYARLVIGPGDAAVRAAYAALDVPHYRIAGHGRYSSANARELMRIIRREKIDVVHANLYAGETFGRLAALLTGTPIVTHKRGMPYKSRKPQNVLADWGLNLLSDRIIVVNTAIREQLLRLQWLPEDRFSVVYPGLDPELWRRASPERIEAVRAELGLESRLVVACVARLWPIKGHAYLLEAAPRIFAAHPDAHLLLVGHGVLEAELLARAEALGLGARVSFAGMRRDIREILSLADVFALPSLSEASPVSLMEAAFMGVPSVATRVGGVPEVVRDGETGLLVPPRNVEALAEAIGGLLADPERRARMSGAAMEWARTRFDINRTVRQVEGEYVRAAGRSC